MAPTSMGKTQQAELRKQAALINSNNTLNA